MSKATWLRTLVLSGLAAGATRLLEHAGADASAAAGVAVAGAGLVTETIQHFLIHLAHSQREAQHNEDERLQLAERNHHLRSGMAHALRRALQQARNGIAALPANPYQALFKSWEDLLALAQTGEESALERFFPAQFSESYWEATNPYRGDPEEDARALAALLLELPRQDAVHTKWTDAQALEFARQVLPYYQRAFADDLVGDSHSALHQAFVVKRLNRIESLAEQILSIVSRFSSPSVQPGPVLDVDQLLTKTWEISASQLTGLLDVSNLNPDASAISDKPQTVLNLKYAAQLFTSPQEGATLDSFLASDKRGMLLVGESGIGKSNLLCDRFLHVRRQGQAALFLSARGLDAATVYDGLIRLARRLNATYTLESLDASLAASGKTLTVFLDAVNEYYKADGGPLTLLRNIVDFVHDARLRNIRLVATCRSETWAQYVREAGPKPLSPTVFFPPTGDPVCLSGFEADPDRARLYDHYQRYHNLKPATYRELPSHVKALIRQPFLMSLIAETYSNRDLSSVAPSASRTISPDLDYFAVFRRLTNRKLDDSVLPWSTSSALRAYARSTLESCLYELGSLLLRQLTTHAPSNACSQQSREQSSNTNSDAVLFGLIPKRLIQPLVETGGPSPIDVLLDVGLLQSTSSAVLDVFGEVEQANAIRYFHDRYAQYWIAAVYLKETLGITSTPDLTSMVLTDLIAKIECLFGHAIHAPILSGALDHWFHRNMRRTQGKVDLLLPVFCGIARSASGALRHYVGTFFSGMLSNRLIKPDVLWQGVLTCPDANLKRVIINSFLETWRDLPEGTFRTFLDLADKEHNDSSIRCLANVFSQLFSADPIHVLQTLSVELRGFERPISLRHIKSPRFAQHSTFLVHFAPIALLSNFEDSSTMSGLTSFLQMKCRALLAILRAAHTLHFGTNQISKFVYELLQQSGANMWEQTVASQGNSDLFGDGGRAQRELLISFYPYLIAIHNGEGSSLSLAVDSPLFALIKEMIAYRPASIVGYVAATVSPLLVRAHPDGVQDLIVALVRLNSPSGRFFANLLAVNCAFVDPRCCRQVLSVMKTDIVPALLDHPTGDDWPLLGCTAVADVDYGTLWPQCEEILQSIVREISEHRHDRRMTFGDALVKCTYYPGGQVGIRIARFLLSNGYLDVEMWRAVVVKVLAGVAVTDPMAFGELVASGSVPRDVKSTVRQMISDELLASREQIRYETSWNKFIAKELASSVKVRYFLVSILMRSLVVCTSVEDWGLEFARFVVNTIRAVLDEKCDASAYTRLSMEDVFPGGVGFNRR